MPTSRRIKTALALLTALSGAAFFGVSSALYAGVEVSEKSSPDPVDMASLKSANEPLMRIGNYKASAIGVIARVSTAPGKMADASVMMQKEGLTVEQRYTLVPGLMRLTQKDRAAGAFSSNQMKALIERLKATGVFEYVEPDWRVHVLNEPSDSAYSNGTLWGLRNTGQSGGVAGIDINVVPAWSTTTGSSAVIVGVIDTGIRYNHQDLAANMWVNSGEIAGNGVDDDGNGYIDDIFGINAITNSGDPNDDNDHGTHVAGTIAASGFDAGQHVGVAYTSKLMALKFLDQDGSGATSDAIKCIEYAVSKGVDILNNSWGGGGSSQALLDAIEAANDAGVLFLAAAGNSASNNDQTASFPANYNVENVISVAAIDRSGNLASFSSFGATTVDIAAPGVSIFSSTSSSNSSYSSFNGTSMATPHVAGVAALLKSANPSADVAELRSRLLLSAAPLASLSGRVVTGGMVDAAAALGIAADGTMEVSVNSPVLEAGATARIEVRVTDLEPVINATVLASFAGTAQQSFLDNGVAPDATARDGTYTAELQAPASGTSASLTVNVTAPGKTDASEVFEIPLTTPPDNDSFAARIVVPTGSTMITGTNRFATAESGEPRNPSVAGGRTVWWAWQPPSGLGSATISTSGSDFDTTLAVYTGNSVSGLTLVASNDDSGGTQSAVTFALQAGQTYAVQVDGYAGATGDIRLNYPAPGGSSGAPVIVAQPAGQTVLEGDPFTLEVQASPASGLTYQWVRVDGSSSTPITGATSAEYTVTSSSEADEGVYAVVVSNSVGQITSRSVFVAVEKVGVLPPNDRFTNASLLPGGSGRVDSSNVRATGENAEPNHAGLSLPLASAWFEWEAPGNGQVQIDTLGSDYDTTLAVYTGSSLGSLALVASNDDFAGLQSAVLFSVTAGTTYRIAVDGFSSREGQIILNYAFAGAQGPTNDAFASRVALGTNDAVSGANIGASGEGGEPNHALRSVPIASVWWSWIAPSSGDVVFSTAGSNFDTTLAVYTGASPSALQTVAFNDDSGGLQSAVAFTASSGTTYAIAVDGFGANEGNIALSVNFSIGESDEDGDGAPDGEDNCPAIENQDQADADGDGAGDVCDAFPLNPSEILDSDGDGMGDAFEDQYGLDKNNADDAAIDTDDDGTSNLQEFLDGTVPTEFDAAIGISIPLIRAAVCAGEAAPSVCE